MIIRWLIGHFWKFAKWLLFGVVAYLLAGIAGSLAPLGGEARSSAGIQVFVVSNGVHTDLCLPINNAIKDWRGTFPPQTAFPGREVAYLCFGWGELNFFVNTPRWSDLTAKTALRAILWPSAAAMHVTPWSQEPLVNTRCRRIFLSEDQYRRLCGYIEESFALSESGMVQDLGKGYGGGDKFYAAIGAYHLFNTCNEWTSRGLHLTGIQTALWAPFAQSVMLHLP